MLHSSVLVGGSPVGSHHVEYQRWITCAPEGLTSFAEYPCAPARSSLTCATKSTLAGATLVSTVFGENERSTSEGGLTSHCCVWAHVVLSPVPPCKVSLPPPPTRTSLPGPPISTSLPGPPSRTSSPGPPSIMLLDVSPMMRSLPEPPRTSSTRT